LTIPDPGTAARLDRFVTNSQIERPYMDENTNRIISLTMLAAVPVLGALGFAAITGLIGM
jgi:hypothetical protein